MTTRYTISLAVTGLGAALLLSACGTQPEASRPVFGYSGIAAGDLKLSTYEQAKADFMAGRYGLAVKRFNMAMVEEPASIEAVNGLAASYDQIGRFDLAERYYQRALAMDPNSVQTLNNLGYSLMLQGKNDLAVALLRDAAQRDPDNAVVIANARIAVAAMVAKRDSKPDDAAEPKTPAAEVRPAKSGAQIVRVSAEVQTLHLAAPSGGPQIAAAPVVPVVTQPLPPLPEPADTSIVSRPAAVLPTVEGAAAAQRPAVYYIKSATGPDVRMPAGPSEALATAADLTGSIEVANGTGRRHMAARLRSYLAGFDLTVTRLANADSFSHRSTTVTYRPGHRSLAEALSATLPVAPVLRQVTDQAVDVRVELGGDLLEFDRGLLQAERNTSHADAV